MSQLTRPRYVRKLRLAELRARRGDSALLFGVFTLVFFLIGLAAMAKAGFDWPTAGEPCYTAAEYPTCFPSREVVRSNFVMGAWIAVISGVVLLMCYGAYRFARRGLPKH